MRAAVVAVLDRDEWEANTDIIVVADPQRRRLTWVPRDLWSDRLQDRINGAFRRGGCEELIGTLRDFGFDCDAALIVRRGATEAALAPLTVTVRVSRPLHFWYPLAPTLPIEEGRKQISFLPPAETLSGERIHQWIGARKNVAGGGSDLHRLRRQQVLLRALIAEGFDFDSVVSQPELLRRFGDPLDVLRRVDAGWSMGIFGPTGPARLGQQAVLLKTTYLRLAMQKAARIRAQLRGPPRKP